MSDQQAINEKNQDQLQNQQINDENQEILQQPKNHVEEALAECLKVNSDCESNISELETEKKHVPKTIWEMKLKSKANEYNECAKIHLIIF